MILLLKSVVKIVERENKKMELTKKVKEKIKEIWSKTELKNVLFDEKYICVCDNYEKNTNKPKCGAKVIDFYDNLSFCGYYESSKYEEGGSLTFTAELTVAIIRTLNILIKESKN